MSDALLQPSMRLSPSERRRSIYNAYANAGWWGLGNGLAGTTLFFYLAQSFGASGFQLSWLLAAAPLAGVLRLFTPLWMDRVGNRKRFCIAMFLASAVAMLGLPLMSAPGWLPHDAQSITSLLVCWTTYNLLENFAVVALWTWLGDLVPGVIRGRFVGRRAAWRSGGRVCGGILSAVGILLWQRHCEETGSDAQQWIGFAGFAAAGALALALAVWPLIRMSDVPSPSEVGHHPTRLRLSELLQPFVDRRFRKLLAFGCWFSFANGITETAVRVFKIVVLNLTFTEKRTLDAASRGIQTLLLPRIGIWADRHSNVFILMVSQGLVAVAILFLLPASAEAKWWIMATYALWTAYAGMNVALPNLMIELYRPECSAAYTAAWFATTQAAYAISVLCGGALYDWMELNWQTVALGSWHVNHYAALFLLGFLLRLLGIPWARRISESKAI